MRHLIGLTDNRMIIILVEVAEEDEGLPIEAKKINDQARLPMALDFKCVRTS